MKEFIETKTKGRLFIDKILFESNIPILFVCKNEKDELFLCVCCQSNNNGRKWLVSGVDEETIIKMLSDRISLREAFLADDSFRLSVQRTKDGISIGYNEEDWKEESIYLPKKGEYMEAEEGEFDEEIEYYNERLRRKDYKDPFVSILTGSEALSSLDLNSISVNSWVLPEYGSSQFEGEVIETIKDARLARGYLSDLLSGLVVHNSSGYSQVNQYFLAVENMIEELYGGDGLLLAA